METKTLEELTDDMRQHTGLCAPGSECNHWQDYVQDCVMVLGCLPWSDDHLEKVVPADFAAHWTEVAR